MFDCKKLVESFTNEELTIYIETNEIITRLDGYGTRREIVPANNSTRLVWFNGDRAWSVSPPGSINAEDVKRKGDEVRLGPHEFVVPYPYKIMKKIAPCLKPLPLYMYSFEAKQKGEVDSFGATFGWAMKQYERIKREEYQKGNR